MCPPGAGVVVDDLEVCRPPDQALHVPGVPDEVRAVLAGGRAHPHGPSGLVGTPREVSRCLDLGLRLERSTDGRAASGVRLVTSYDGGEHLDLLLDPATGDLVVDRGAGRGRRRQPDERGRRPVPPHAELARWLAE
jgi:hypothetical protein